MKLRAGLSVFVALLITHAFVVHAELLVYEPFDYTGGMNGADGTSEIGFDAAAWDASVSSVNATATGTNTNIQFGSGKYVLRSGGNAGRFQVSNDVSSAGSGKWFRGVNASLGAGNDLWLAYLTRTYTDLSTPTGRSINTLIENTGGAIEFLPKRNGVDAAHIRVNSGPASDLTGGRITDTETYMVIAKYGLNTNGFTGTIDAWVLTETQFDGVASDGAISETELNAITPYAKASQSGILAKDILLDLTDQFSFFFTPNVASVTLDIGYDELRLADTLVDAVPIVPWGERVSDTFDDDSFLYNKTGTGLGFDNVSNNVGGSGTRSESNGVLTVTTTGINNNSGVGSKASIAASSDDKVVVRWDVASVANWASNGLELMIQAGTAFREKDCFQIKFDGSGKGSINTISGTTTALYGPANHLGIGDGFTAVLTAKQTGWTLELTGATIGGQSTFSGSGYGSSSFLDLFADGIVAITVQGKSPVAVLVVNEITASVTRSHLNGTVIMVL